MTTCHDILRLQKEQHSHDREYHTDILCLAKSERMKHYGLHYAKYVGRLARSSVEAKTIEQTVVDTFLICLSAANTLNQRLSDFRLTECRFNSQNDVLLKLADATGRFADACEKSDHWEPHISIARDANVDIMRWAITISVEIRLDIEHAIQNRRRELAVRPVYKGD